MKYKSNILNGQKQEKSLFLYYKQSFMPHKLILGCALK